METIIFVSCTCAYLFIDGMLKKSDIGLIQMLFSALLYMGQFVGVL